MATISTASIQDGQIVYAEHVLRIINALNGSASNNIIINSDLVQGSLSNTANGSTSFAHGSGSTANGIYSHAEGYETIASGAYSHAEGYGATVTVSGVGAHAEGFNTIAGGLNSHAEGRETNTVGRASHAEGWFSNAVGNYSHADGLGTIAYADSQTATGRYNKDLNTIDYFVVGYGTGSSAGARADALGVNASGSYISSSFFLPTLSSASQSGVLTYDPSTKQVYYTSSLDLVVSQSVNAISASYAATASIAESASYALTASYVESASYALSASQADSSSFAITASYALNANVFPYTGSAQITGSLGVTGSTSFKIDQGSGTQIINLLAGTNTSGYALSIGVNNDGVNFSNNSGLRGFNFKNNNGTLYSISPTGTLSGSIAVITSITGSLYGTASWAISASAAISASGAISSSYAESSSYALSASYATNALSSSYAGSSSYAVSSSLAVSASYAANGGVTQITGGSGIQVSPGGTGVVNIINTLNTGSLLRTASISLNTITFTKGDNTQFSITVDTGSGGGGGGGITQITAGNGIQVSSGTGPITTITNTLSTGSLLSTASISSNILTFTKGDGSTFNITILSASYAPTNGDVLITASNNPINNSIEFTKADSTTFSVTVNNVENADSASYAETASYVESASYATTASYVTSASYATTASYAANGGVTQITGGSGIQVSPGGTGVVTITNTLNTGSLLSTASVSLNTITFTKGDNTQFSITVDTGSGGGGGGGAVSQIIGGAGIQVSPPGTGIVTLTNTLSTGSLLRTASMSPISNVMTFTKGDNTTFNISITSASYAPTNGDVIVNAANTPTNDTIEFTKADSTTFSITVNNVNNATNATNATNAETASYVADLIKTASVSLNTITFTKGNGSTFNITLDTGSTTQYVLNSTFNPYTSSINSYTASLNNWTGSNTSLFGGTASYVNLITGPGIYINGLEITASVRTVNGASPDPVTGNIVTALTQTAVGTSASLIISSSGAVTASLPDGLVWVIAGDTNPANNGDTFIWSSGSKQWYSISSPDTASWATNALTSSFVRIQNTTGTTVYPLYSTGLGSASPGTARTLNNNSGITLNTTTKLMTITASWAQRATTSSFAFTASYVTGSIFTSTNLALSASFAGSSSYSLTASYVTGSIFTGTNLARSSSFAITASYVTGSIFTGTNLARSSSFAITASYSLVGLQQVLNNNRDLINGNNYQGTQAGLNNTGTNVNALGTNAATDNTGTSVNALGISAAQDNIGNDVNALGNSAAQDNTGDYVNTLGFEAGFINTGNYVDALGYRAAYQNTGSNVIAIGGGTTAGAAQANSGDAVIAIGDAAAQGNTSDHVNAIGVYAALFNAGGAYINALGLGAARNNTGAFHVNALGWEAAMYQSGSNVNALGYSATNGNRGDNVNALGNGAAKDNLGSNVNAFGFAAGQNNTLSGQTIFSNTSMPSYANSASAASAITVLNGATAGCTYLYYDQFTEAIRAIRL